MQSRNFGAFLNQALQATSLLVLTVLAIAPADAANKNVRLPRTTVMHMAYAPSISSRNGLPATTMDSFVRNAGSRADAIYGDEGQGDNPPPFYEGFTARHRINAGIVGQQDAGLTTGHGSMLPDAWGRDEYLGGQEWSQSGPNNGAYSQVSSPDIVASYDLPQVAPSFNNRNSAGATAGSVSYGAGNVGLQTAPRYSTYGSASAKLKDSGF